MVVPGHTFAHHSLISLNRRRAKFTSARAKQYDTVPNFVGTIHPESQNAALPSFRGIYRCVMFDELAEQVYIQMLRLIAMGIDENFQAAVRKVCVSSC